MNIRAFLLGSLAGVLAALTSASANAIYFATPGPQTLEIVGAYGTKGTVTSPEGFTADFVIGANHTATVTIPVEYVRMNSAQVSNKGFVIQTKNPRAVVGARLAGADTTMLMDSRALGRSYIALAYTGEYRGGMSVDPSELTLVGTKDGTTVVVTPGRYGYYIGSAGLGEPSYTEPRTFVLNKGQAINFESYDVTGYKINASAPIAAFGSSHCASPPGSASRGDTPICPGGPVITALPDTSKFTRSAVVPTSYYATGSNNIGDAVRVLAKADGTVVRWNGTVVATLAAGESTEFESGTGGVVTASKPVLVGKVTKFKVEGDVPFGSAPGLDVWRPGMTWIPGTDQWTNHYVFDFLENEAFDSKNYLDIAIRTADLWSLRLNGERISIRDDCQRIGGGYSACELLVGEGIGEIWAAHPFLALLVENAQALSFAGADFLPQPWLHQPFLFAARQAEVPAPATLLIAGAGLIGLALIRRRKR